MDAPMGRALIGFDRDPDLLVDYLALFVVIGGRARRHLIKLRAFGLVGVLVLLEGGVLMGFITRFKDFFAVCQLRLLVFVRDEDAHSFFGLEKDLDGAFGVQVEVDREAEVALGLGLGQREDGGHVVEKLGDAVRVGAQLAIKGEELVHVLVEGLLGVVLRSVVGLLVLVEHVVGGDDIVVPIHPIQLALDDLVLLLGHLFGGHGRLKLLQSLLPLRSDLLPLDLGLCKVVPLPMIVNAVALSRAFRLHKELPRLILAILLVMRQHLLGAGRS